MMPLDPQLEALLKKLSVTEEPIADKPLANLRREFADRRKELNNTAISVNVRDHAIPGPGGEIPTRIYTPDGTGPFPILVYFHGGGWVLGDRESEDGICRHIAQGANCIVLSVDYRLAPEHPFPAAIEDAYAAIKWSAEHAGTFRGDSTRLAVGGDSAGGNLATVGSMMVRDLGGPPVVFQLLIYPVTHYSFASSSYRDYGKGYFLTEEEMRYFWGSYLSDDKSGANPYASPLLADDLSRLPPALVITAEYDPLRDEGEAYADRLQDAGNSVQKRRYNGMMHSFLSMSGTLEQAEKALGEIEQVLISVFDKPQMQ